MQNASTYHPDDLFHELFQQWNKRYYAAAIKMNIPAHLAEEIVQDVFTIAWRKKEELVNMDNPTGYLFTILYNKIYAQIKQLSRERVLTAGIAEDIAEEEAGLLDHFRSEEAHAFLKTAISKLPAQQRQVIELIRFQGMSRQQAAEKLGLSANTVRNHLAAAMNNLKAEMDRWLPVLVWILVNR